MSLRPLWLWLGTTFNTIAWDLWLCFPDRLRSAVYLRLAKWYDVGRWNMDRLPFGLILKHTHENPPTLETSNISFVRNNTSIPVPEVLDTIPPRPGHPVGLIIMKAIEGITLHEWLNPRVTFPPEFHHYLDLLANGDGTRIDELRTILLGFEPVVDLSDSSELISDLRRALLELRAIIPPPSGQVSGANGAPFITLRFSNRDILQPFENIEAFHEMLLQSCWIRSRLPRLRKLAKPVYARRHRLFFSHLDLSIGNILVKDGGLAGIVDWETAGWFPEYYEYTTLQIRNISHVKGLRIFWDAVGVFDHEQYRDELHLEQALFRSAGNTALVPGIIPDDPIDRPLSDDEAEA
ncbi:kinase-like protein [Armillaria novae-zelandiae]|uniref:Kinase-like protein n=1 Tax=Armillaria novae-zelandiae TaxID=153914 RepID=A0AA39UAG7_9AGAR|nr:kinase-like protein [Armillaria novae-zelandiae]